VVKKTTARKMILFNLAWRTGILAPTSRIRAGFVAARGASPTTQILMTSNVWFLAQPSVNAERTCTILVGTAFFLVLPGSEVRNGRVDFHWTTQSPLSTMHH
jgi:hypothetical protein